MTNRSQRIAPSLSGPSQSAVFGQDDRPDGSIRPGSAAVRSSASPRATEPRFDPIAWRSGNELERQSGDQADPPAFVAAAASSAVSRQQRHSTMQWKYIAGWAGVGAISLAYLAAMGWQRSANLESAIAPVTESIERMATDIAELKQVTAALDTREKATAARLDATETRLSGFAQAASPALPGGTIPASAQGRPTNRTNLADDSGPAQSGALGNQASAAATEPVKPTRVIAGMVVVPPGAPAGIAVAPLPQANATASDQKSKPAAAPTPAAKAVQAPVINTVRTGSIPEPTSARHPTGLLIASGPSLESIRLSWNVLSQNHGAVLGSLEPRVLPSSDGSAFNLIAGPFSSDADATKACTALKARGVGCRYTDYQGSSL